MRASVFIGTSLDGVIARANGDFDFLPPGGGEPHGFDEFISMCVFLQALMAGPNTHVGTFIHLQGLTLEQVQRVKALARDQRRWNNARGGAKRPTGDWVIRRRQPAFGSIPL